jgi:diguanylate cyclase (GGDEF)-like protein
VRSWMADKSLRLQIAVAAAAGAVLAGTGAAIGSLGRSVGSVSPSLAVGGVIAGGLVGVGVASYLARRALRPIEQLRDSMSAVAGGRLEIAITPCEGSSHELRELTETFGKMVERMRQAEDEHEQSRRDVEVRTKIVDRLLDFSQTIQGAGRADQIFESLGQSLQHALKLEGYTVLAHDTDQMPPTQVKACRPEELCPADRPIGEMDPALCPCLRQNQPRVFRPDVAGVRCTIEGCLKLPTNCAAYCIPFNVGRKQQVVVHMLLPVGEKWTEERRQLAQTYVNAAQSALSSLHLLAEAEKQSMTDSLTGLYNRRSLEQILEREVALADRHHRPLSVVMIDMDLFKEVNDRHGHAAGDHLLKSFAECVRITLRKTDLAFRYGGDEFLIALPQTTVEQAKAVVQKLRQAFSVVDFSSAIANLDQQPTLSIGLAERSKDHNVMTLSSLLSAADTALYDAKTSNRNCMKVYEPKAA